MRGRARIQPSRPDRPPPRARVAGALATLLLAAPLLAAGCATSWKYEKPGADQTRTKADTDACLALAKTPPESRDIVLVRGAVMSFPYEDVDPLRFDDCMVARGYTRISP